MKSIDINNIEKVRSFINTSYKLKPKLLYISKLKWKHLIRSVIRGKNILITGPKGSGKTLTALSLSSVLDRPQFKFSLGSTQDPRSFLIGNTSYSPERGTFFSDSLFIQAIQTKNAVILLDELSRANPEAWNILMPVLDETQRFVRIEESISQRTINVAEGVTFISTANIGHEYTSTRTLDLALLDRFTIIEMDTLNYKQEMSLLSKLYPSLPIDTISIIAKIVTWTRVENKKESSIISTELSTRTSVEMGSLLYDGFTLSEVCDMCVYPQFDNEGGVNGERALVSQYIQKFDLENKATLDSTLFDNMSSNKDTLISDELIKKVSN